MTVSISIAVLKPWVIPEASIWPESLRRWVAYAGRYCPAGGIMLLEHPLYAWFRRTQSEYIGRLLVPARLADGRKYFKAAHACSGGLQVAMTQADIDRTITLSRLEDMVGEKATAVRAAMVDQAPRNGTTRVFRIMPRPCGCGKTKVEAIAAAGASSASLNGMSMQEAAEILLADPEQSPTVSAVDSP